jgi:two-component system, NtrC family, sensor histidine kinase KinB
MTWVQAAVFLLLFATALLATWLALLAWQRRVRPWSGSFTVLMLAVALWSLGQVLELEAGDAAAKVFWAMVQLPGIVAAPVAWFLFGQRFGRHERWLRRAPVLLIALPALLTLALGLAHPLPGAGELFWRDVTVGPRGPFTAAVTSYGPWYWVHVGYSSLLLLGGAIRLQPALLERMVREGWRSRVALVVAVWLPLPAFLLARVAPLAVDLAPVAFTLSGALIAWALLRHGLWALVPVALRTVFDQMLDGVLVVNVQERIVDANPAAEGLLGRAATELRGAALGEALPQWAAIWERSREEPQVESEVALAQADGVRQYEMRVAPLLDGRGERQGRLVVWRDVTERQAAAAALLARQVMYEKLLAVARATATGLTLEATLRNALAVACDVTGAEQGSIFLLNAERRITASILARGGDAAGDTVGQVMEEGLAGWAVRNRQTVIIEDTEQEPRWLTLPDQPYTVRSVLVAPVVSGETTPGVLTLQHSQPGHFQKGDVELMEAAAHQMALALQNAQIYEQQRRLAAQQQTVYHVLATVGEKLEERSVTEVAVETIRELTGWPGVAILEPQGQELVVRAATGLLHRARGLKLPFGEGHSGAAYLSARPRLVRDLNAEPGFHKVDGLGSLIAVPLRRRERLGVFLVASDEPDAFGKEELRTAELLAESLALGMANARLFQAVSEEQTRLQALIAASRDGIMLIGVDRRLLVVNPRALDYWGLEGQPEDWVNAPLAQLYLRLRQRDPEAAAIIDAEVRRIESGHTGPREGELVAGGRELHWINLPVVAGETMLGRLIVLQDVSRERELQRMRDDVTHMMVHDLRNPLNVVASGLQMAQAGLDPAAQAGVVELLEIAAQSTARMLALVNDILNISRLESGKLPLERKVTCLEAVVNDVIEAQVTLAVEKGLRLTTKCEPSLPPAYVDPWLVERIVYNLVGNAIKFTPVGGSIETELQLGDGEFVITVRDSGPGLPAGLRETVFEKFVTGEGRDRGSGLGLAFCQLAVEAHGGRIWVNSVEGKGAAFSFTLPVAAEDQPVT